ncbi:hypothetical protein [Corynebacterium epidermidicanis]|uniref:Transmembrane protein n=1 Tax=Corynebacterium epidermidicanis TaxID=1050174 RepID=A0A0G3GNM4_9CORY|nr:hypothetical protein [Corynebacterium epidermidicanis]AKK02140.1 hypothetical protein CEPID_01265 [Corynebacterium epidermidicanis]
MNHARARLLGFSTLALTSLTLAHPALAHEHAVTSAAGHSSMTGTSSSLTTAPLAVSLQETDPENGGMVSINNEPVPDQAVPETPTDLLKPYLSDDEFTEGLDPNWADRAVPGAGFSLGEMGWAGDDSARSDNDDVTPTVAPSAQLRVGPAQPQNAGMQSVEELRKLQEKAVDELHFHAIDVIASVFGQKVQGNSEERRNRVMAPPVLDQYRAPQDTSVQIRAGEVIEATDSLNGAPSEVSVVGESPAPASDSGATASKEGESGSPIPWAGVILIEDQSASKGQHSGVQDLHAAVQPEVAASQTMQPTSNARRGSGLGALAAIMAVCIIAGVLLVARSRRQFLPQVP